MEKLYFFGKFVVRVTIKLILNLDLSIAPFREQDKLGF